MSQFIEVVKTNERGEIIQPTEINFAPIIMYIQSSKIEKEYPWISTIDEYGLTMINHLQAKYIVSELEKLLGLIEGEGLKSPISEVVALLSGLENHKYVKFLGD